jgi:hypothetical protein
LIVAKYQSRKWQWVFYSFALIFSWPYHRQGFHRIYYINNMTDVVWETGTVYSSRGPVGSVLLLFLIFCIVRFVLFVIALYLVPSVVNVYGLSSLVRDRSVSCAQCCKCLWIVQSCLWSLCILCPVLSMSMNCPVLLVTLCLLCPVLPVSMNCPVLFVIVLCLVSSVANVYELSSLVCDRSVSCAQCCQCLWIVQSRLPYWFSL